MFSSVQFNDVFKKLKTRLGVDEEGVEGDGGDGGGGDGVVPGSSGATTPNGVGRGAPPETSAAAAAANGGTAVNGTSTANSGDGDGGGGGGGGGGGEGQPRLSAFETTRNYKYLPRLELRSPSGVVNSIRERLGGGLGVATSSGGVPSQTNGEATGAALSSNTLQSQSGTESSDSNHMANQYSVFSNLTNHAASDSQAGAKEDWDEGVSWQKVKDRLTGERVKSLFAPSRFSLSGWGAKQPDDAQLNGELPDLNDPDLHKAAITIQAAYKFYRNSKTRREREEREANEQASSLSEDDRRDIEAIDMEDPKLHDAAAKIQATFKGHRFRKSADVQTAQVRAAKAAAVMVNNIKNPEEEEEVVDIDLADPKTAEAAAQIQAAFRGMQIRKKKPMPAAAVASTNPFAPSPVKTAPPRPAPARPPVTRPVTGTSSSTRNGGSAMPSRGAPPPQRPPSSVTSTRPPGVPARPPRPGPGGQ